MVLTSSDIGSNPERIESILSERFIRASSWGAVLLIDEADVFMEKRSSNDLKRNSLVAGSLLLAILRSGAKSVLQAFSEPWSFMMGYYS
jgi:hypothetical protein